MGINRPDITGLCPPSDNGSIEQALSHANEKLAAWAAAMLEAQTHLTSAERSEDESSTPAAEVRPDVAGAQETEAVTENETSPEMTAEAEPECACRGSEAPAACDNGQRSEADRNDDEALLASLDQETANAIRVMRRLAPGHKSVRELLKQYQEGTAAARTAPTSKKSWFSRR